MLYKCGHGDGADDGESADVCPSCVVERGRFLVNAARMLQLTASGDYVSLMRFIRSEYGPFVKYGPRQRFVKTVDPVRARWLSKRRGARKRGEPDPWALGRAPCIGRYPWAIAKAWPRIRAVLANARDSAAWLGAHPDAPPLQRMLVTGVLAEARREGVGRAGDLVPSVRDRVVALFDAVSPCP